MQGQLFKSVKASASQHGLQANLCSVVLMGIHTLERVQETSGLCSQALDISSSALPVKSTSLDEC